MPDELRVGRQCLLLVNAAGKGLIVQEASLTLSDEAAGAPLAEITLSEDKIQNSPPKGITLTDTVTEEGEPMTYRDAYAVELYDAYTTITRHDRADVLSASAQGRRVGGLALPGAAVERMFKYTDVGYNEEIRTCHHTQRRRHDLHQDAFTLHPEHGQRDRSATVVRIEAAVSHVLQLRLTYREDDQRLTVEQHTYSGAYSVSWGGPP